VATGYTLLETILLHEGPLTFNTGCIEHLTLSHMPMLAWLAREIPL